MKKIILTILTAGLFFYTPAVPVIADEQPEFYEQVYLTEKDALTQVFGDLTVEKKVVSIDKEKLKVIQKRLRRKVPETAFTFYIGKKDGKEVKYALILDEKGKHFPITFIVSMNNKVQVDEVAVMVYREKRGDAVKRKRFLNQFPNKSSKDRLEVNVDIVHLTGATISSWSIASGVKKAIVLTEELLKK